MEDQNTTPNPFIIFTASKGNLYPISYIQNFANIDTQRNSNLQHKISNYYKIFSFKPDPNKLKTFVPK